MPKKYEKMINLTRKRKEKGFTEKALAEKLGIHQNTISYYEKGWRFPRRDILEKLAKALDCKISDIV